jgi:hypothetical protein
MGRPSKAAAAGLVVRPSVSARLGCLLVGPAERGSSRRSGNPSVRRGLTVPQCRRGQACEAALAAAGLVVRPTVSARPGRRDLPSEAAAAGLIVRPSVAARPGRRGRASEAAAAGLVVSPIVSARPDRRGRRPAECSPSGRRGPTGPQRPGRAGQARKQQQIW